MAKRGTKPIPTEIKRLKGTLELSRVLDNEMDFDLMEGIPAPPERNWPVKLKTIWIACCTSLYQVNLLYKEDLAQLRIYCFAVHKIMWIEAKLLKEKEVVTVVSVNKVKYKKRNDWLSPYLEYVKIADKFGAKFGFSPSDRTRIAGAQKNPNDPMGDLMP